VEFQNDCDAALALPAKDLIVPAVCIKPKVSVAFCMQMQGRRMQTDGTLQLDQHKKKSPHVPDLAKASM